MSNRSYLYAVDTIPDADHTPKPIRGLSEFGADVPLSHKILVSRAPRRCRSAIWRERELGIAGDVHGAVPKLLEFAAAIARSGKPKHAKAFAKAIVDTEAFLAAEAHQGKYFLLEAGEIFDASGGSLDRHAKRLLAELPAVAERVDAAIGGGEVTWLAELREDWRNQLGIEWWSDVLYYSFD